MTNEKTIALGVKLRQIRNGATLTLEQRETLTAAAEMLDEYDHSFELRWKADMYAIKRWQAEAPGRDLTWPDHADLCVWLLERQV